MAVQPQLLGPDGRVISSAPREKTAPTNKKAPPPATGDAFGAWAGRDREFINLPGGGVVQFDLSKLEVGDFRNMRDHYQVNASLAVLSFMQHQSDWRIECEDKKIADAAEEQLRNNWTYLNRAMSQANWAGYSPNALQWENEGRAIKLDKIKDLVPEECVVKWDLVDGWAPPGRTPPKHKVYGGIKQDGAPYPIPVENSFWYPLLMENGDYYGRKLLRPAFTSYFFSILIHLFSNRYYERFGEPVPVGRAPFDEDVTLNGSSKPGNEYMLEVLQDLRNRSVIVLPSDKTATGNETNPGFDYELEYLESQMRGADFERYLTRLDEEISIGLFTPILLLRTADVGSYNLGVGHMQMYLWMLNAMNDDRKVYIDKYILSKWTDYNFGPNAPRPKIKFRKLGNANVDMIKELLNELTRGGKVKFDYVELGEIAGMTLTEVKETVDPAPAPATGDDAEDPGTDTGTTDAVTLRPRYASAMGTDTAIVNRVRQQVEAAFKSGTLDRSTKINMGFKKRMLKEYGTQEGVNAVYETMDNYLEMLCGLGIEEYEDANDFVDCFANKLHNEIWMTLGGS